MAELSWDSPICRRAYATQRSSPAPALGETVGAGSHPPNPPDTNCSFENACKRGLNAPAARVATLPSLDASSSFYFLTNRLLGTGAKREGHTSIFMSKVSIREILTWGFSPRNVPIVSRLTSQSWLQSWFSTVCEFSLSRMSTYQTQHETLESNENRKEEATIPSQLGLHGHVFQPQHHTEKDGDDNDLECRHKTKLRPQRLQGYGPGSCRCLDVGIELFLTTMRHSNVSWVLPLGMFYTHRAGLVQLTDSSLARTPELTKQSHNQCGPGKTTLKGRKSPN